MGPYSICSKPGNYWGAFAAVDHNLLPHPQYHLTFPGKRENGLLLLPAPYRLQGYLPMTFVLRGSEIDYL